MLIQNKFINDKVKASVELGSLYKIYSYLDV